MDVILYWEYLKDNIKDFMDFDEYYWRLIE